MTFVLAYLVGMLGLILVPRVRHRLTDAKLAVLVQALRGAGAEPRVFRVATEEERTSVPSVNVSGMRELGAIATTNRGTFVVLRYVVDETRTIIATRSSAALFVTSMAGKTQYSTYCLRVGLASPTPHDDREWFPIHAPDHKLVAAHRARIAKAAEPLVRVVS